MRFVLYIVSLLFCSTVSFASDCKVIEYPDHNEVVCDGENLSQNPNAHQNSTRISECKLTIAQLNLEMSSLSERIKSEKNEAVLAQLFSEYDRKMRDTIFYQDELAELTIKNPYDLAISKQKNAARLSEIDQLSQKTNAIFAANSLSDLVKISNIQTAEINRGPSYAYYSVKAEVDNLTDKPISGSFVLQARNYDHHVLDSVTIYFKLDKKETKLFTQEKMIGLEFIPVLREWVVGKINTR